MDSQQYIPWGNVDYYTGVNTLILISQNNNSCRFKFSIYWDCIQQRWFPPLEQSGCTHHYGHVRLYSSFLRLSTKHVLHERENQLATSSLLSKSSVITTCELMEQRTGYPLLWQQMKYIKQKKIKSTTRM